MDTYTILRRIDALKLAVDNLIKETWFALPWSTQSSGGFISPKEPDSIEEAIQHQINTINSVSKTLNEYATKLKTK